MFVTLLLIGVSQQAVANESGLNFISVKGPELLNMVRIHDARRALHLKGLNLTLK